jgi:hypothetical protein
MLGRMTNTGEEWPRRSLTIAILLGLLLIPATCTHAAGPHSIFIDPRAEANSTDPHAKHQRHPDHTGGSHEYASTGAPVQSSPVSEASGQPSVHDLPSTMLVSIASTNAVIDLPQLLAIPSGNAPDIQRVADRLNGVETPVEVPPPREREI